MPVHYDDWMSDGDALMWHIERDPVLRSTVISVWVLDCMPELDRFKATLDRAVSRIPRLRQRVVEDALGVSTPRWEHDPLFDPAYHVRHVRVPGKGDSAICSIWRPPSLGRPSARTGRSRSSISWKAAPKAAPARS